LNEPTLLLWRRVLTAVSNSRLVLLSHDGSQRDWARGILGRQDIDPARIELAAYPPRARYLALFQNIDISLDTLPYNGHTTSLDSLWMGVPVVTQVGATVVGRAGLSQLTNLDLTALVAQSADEYVSIAGELATARGRLGTLRGTLRQLMEASPLMDAARFTRNIESAYRAMWQQWCAREP